MLEKYSDNFYFKVFPTHVLSFCYYFEAGDSLIYCKLYKKKSFFPLIFTRTC